MIKYALLFLLAAAPSAHAMEIAFEQDESLPLVYLNVAVQGGSTTDPQGQSGVTEFTAEMLLRGTRSRSKAQLDLALDQMGARLETETRAESVIFRGAVLRSQLPSFLALLREVITQPAFSDAEIRKLKAETVSKILEDLGSDESLAGLRFTQALFHGHPYGNSQIGKQKDIEGLKREQVVAHYERLVQDPNLLVIGSGDANPAQIQEWAESVRKLRIARGAPFARPGAAQNAVRRRLIIVDKPDRTQTQVNGGQIGVRMTDPAFFALYLGNYAFGGGSFSARLMDEIRVKHGWSYGASSYFRHGTEPRSWQFYLFPAEKDTPAALETVLRMESELREKGLTPAEFDFAQRSLVNSAGFQFNTPRKRVENILLEKTLGLPEGFMRSYGPELQKVRLPQVNAALHEFLKPDQQTIVVLGTAEHLKTSLAKAAGVPESEVEIRPYTQE